MGNVFNWLKLALPFLSLAYDAAIMLNPAVAAEVKLAIDAIKRATEVPAGDGSVAARGYDEINTFGTNVMNALKTLKDSTISDDNKISQAESLVANLSDPTKVYQAKKGKDAELLATFKTKAKELADNIV